MNNEYSTALIAEMYDIKAAMQKNNFWSDFVSNTNFPEFEVCKDGKYLWADSEEYKESDVMEIIRKCYIQYKDFLLLSMTRRQFNFLIENVELFHRFYKVDNAVMITVI